MTLVAVVNAAGYFLLGFGVGMLAEQLLARRAARRDAKLVEAYERAKARNERIAAKHHGGRVPKKVKAALDRAYGITSAYDERPQ